ncbi:MAG: RecX family transcriptional regulator [Thermomicrobiales bacterium]
MDRTRRRRVDPEHPERANTRPAPRPGRITAITPQRHDPERVSIFLDGAFAFGLHAALVLEHGLQPGFDLDEATARDLLAADEIRRAIATALNALAYRARSEGEIAQRLRQKGFEQPSIDATLERLRDWRYVDDHDFASRWIENRQEHRPRSERMLSQELRQKGVDPATIAGTLADAAIDEVADARDLAMKQRAKLSALDPDTQTRRITGFLSRRGYGWDVIRQALDTPDDPFPDDDRNAP